MITISSLSKNYGNRVLFDKLNLRINPGERIGLIGPNGAGKSTLFSMILGETESSSGAIHINKNIRIGYLPQEASFKSSRTVLTELTEGDDLIRDLNKKKEHLEENNQADSSIYGEILHELEALGYFELEYKAKKILMGLGFKQRDFARPITELSGGWQMRALLAKLLTFRYDLLLLDEPTNYLDLNAALWLKDYLAGFNNAFIMISHDKVFLNEVTNFTLILENGSIFKVQGNYRQYQRIKDEKRRSLTKQFNEQEKKRKQLKTFIARFHGQPTKAASVRAKRSILERMQEIVVPPDIRASIGNFSFPQTHRSGHRVITLENISKSYPNTEVYKDFSFEIFNGEKAVLVGENGAGKSTLLKILAGVVNIDNGERRVGHNIDIGYFSQTRMDVLNSSNTVFEEAYSAARRGFMKQEAIRTILGAFLFTGDDVDKKVKILSGGEKSRLILAKILINPPNFLLLDEPTTHLDVDAVDALVKALSEYQGTIVFISHDINFTHSIANAVFEIKDGRTRKFPGSFDYYLDKRNKDQLSPQDYSKTSKTASSGNKAGEKKRQQDMLRKEGERGRKAHNLQIKEKIKKLKKQREELNLEHSVKSRTIANPHSYRDERSLEEYIIRTQEIERELLDINKEIKNLIRQKKNIED